MANNFRVELKGIKELKSSLNSVITRQSAIAINKEVLAIRVALKDQVSATYTAPGNLEDVLVNKTTSIIKTAKNALSGRLEYKFKPIRLSSFPILEESVPGKTYIRTAKVKVFRKQGYKLIRGKKGFKGFLIKPTRRLNNNSYLRGIYERQQHRTWQSRSNIRAPIKPLFGPTYSQMAQTVFSKNLQLKRKVNNFAVNVQKRLNLE